ncbi:P44/Msp2 family outer membrane protein [Neoehrlichia mikurensis]|uniref:P44/Msp2 family outer membrane protein n=1 Tax=Neoehrlichia mikurensis TaxID=89586 RepID=A0A9Q9BT81_9RICK|nr:P44/Msp2 family outer membrane protein [Neoehrlichia mikurensis]UTO55795.1 P44/Msp2 family outer membrane protein [Neoehrlichia mikurensis]
MAFIPFYSFAQVKGSEGSNNVNNHGFYIGGQYKPGIGVIGDLSVKADSIDIKAILALKADATAEDPVAADKNTPSEVSKFIQKPGNFKGFYKPTYNNSFAGFSGLIGYSTPNGVRLELEGSFENFELKNSNKCTLKNAYKYFAAAAKLKDGNNDEIDDAAAENNENHNKYYYVIKNSNISAAATMINLCYDFTSDALGNGEISPYLCAGVGASLVKALNMPHVKFSYQAKAGVNYFLSNSVAIFADAYYHATHDNTFITPVIHKPIKFANNAAQAADHNKFTDDHVMKFL